ncbi:MAG: APC family permease [Betaproteobacteria bacterium]|nr:MAG: APC family permease [Betaproteobacteria bacterium]
MSLYQSLRQFVVGAPLDPLSRRTRHSLALVAFFAWVGLGADGISSSCYGPEEAFKALGEHTHLGLYLAAATVVTVFVIALAYNQVIELFPTGGGGYRVASRLLGPRAGLVAGAALLVDYVLTIAISVAAGVDALFSLLPLALQKWKLAGGLAIVVLLLVLNLRGMKEAIKVLLPVFLGFIVTHAIMIAYGVLAHAGEFVRIVPATFEATREAITVMGFAPMAAFLLLAYAQGGGTYTGLEAVSNNVNVLAEPRVKTGKLTMLYMAASLAFTAGGIILVYLLWDARPVEGQTLNAVAFGAVLKDMGFATPFAHEGALVVVLALEAGLLFVAANAGFLGGPAVLSNMAADSWVPHKFRYLSTRLVTENGIVVLGVAALAILLWSEGNVTLLVVLYSISVFLTFAISLLGLCVYWWRHRKEARWLRRLALSGTGFAVCAGILALLLYERLAAGGWAAILIIGTLVVLCLAVRHHYDFTKDQLRRIDAQFENVPFGSIAEPPKPDYDAATAVFMVGSSRGGGLHALLWVQRMFPGHFRNFVFINARAVDAHSYGGAEDMEAMKIEANVALKYFENFCHSNGLASKTYLAFGTDPIDGFVELCARVRQDFPNCIFFTSKLIFERDNFLIRLLHNQAALVLQQRLHMADMQMVILPLKVEV